MRGDGTTPRIRGGAGSSSRPAGAQTSITLTTWFEDFVPGSQRGLVLDVDDIDAARSKLEGRGVTFTGETYGTPWGRFAPFSDPDGNGWALHQNA
jgi:predicted enzyme related to lactoylglutathione lyase